jgi:NAD(P)H-nitrite reductase large subunit
VVIGGGVLGLEATSELFRAGIKVTVLEATPQIIGRQADSKSAAILKATMEGLGVACYEGVSIAAIEGEACATGVRLADGRVFPADFVVVSCGNRGNVGPAKEAGIAMERAIVVNDRMETSAPDVYACGDCCQFDGVNFQLWQEAMGQGRTAGANAAGETATYANQPLGLSLEGFGTSLFALGDPGKKPDVPYKTVETTDGVTGRHETYWFFGGRLEGAVVIGAPEKTADITKAVTEHARYNELF